MSFGGVKLEYSFGVKNILLGQVKLKDLIRLVVVDQTISLLLSV